MLYNKVDRPYGHMDPFFFGFPSCLGYQKPPSKVSCAIWEVLISHQFYKQECIYVSSNLAGHPTSPFPLGIHSFLLYVCALLLLCK